MDNNKKDMTDLIWEATQQCPFCDGEDKNQCNCTKCPSCGKDCYSMFGEPNAVDDDGTAICVHCGFDLENYYDRFDYENDMLEVERRQGTEPCPQCGETFEDCVCVDVDEERGG